MTLTIIIGYLALVLAVGLFSRRLSTGTGEDWFLATRNIGPFVLLMTLFGTHMTAFSLLGASGEAYRTGIGVFALMASASAIAFATRRNRSLGDSMQRPCSSFLRYRARRTRSALGAKPRFDRRFKLVERASATPPSPRSATTTSAI